MAVATLEDGRPSRLGVVTRPLGAGSIVHLRPVLPAESRVGPRHVAVPAEGGLLVTSDLLALGLGCADKEVGHTYLGPLDVRRRSKRLAL